MSSVRADLVLVVPNLGVGGLERGTLGLSRAAQELDHSVAVVTLTDDRSPDAEIFGRQFSSNGTVVRSLSRRSVVTYRAPLNLYRTASLLRHELQRMRPRAVISSLLDADLPTRIACHQLGVPHYSYLVNTSLSEEVRASVGGRRLLFAYARLVERLSARYTQRYIALTEAVRDYATDTLHLPRSKILVIPRGVDTSSFRPSDSGSRVPHSVVSLGRLVPQKDHETSIRAICSPQGEPFSLKIYGEGTREESLRVLLDSLRCERAALTRPVANVAPVLQESDVYLSAALWEGQSNALLEAMSSGCLLVLSDTPVFREVAADVAEYFEPGSPKDLAEALQRIRAMSWEQIQTRRQNARQRAVERFDATELDRRAISTILNHAETLGKGMSPLD
jgi:glycosyltransferase involved in cell wall biosynthesis